MTSNKAFTAGAFAIALLATPSFAQSVFDGANVAGDLNDDLIEAIADDAERDTAAFGNEGRGQGFSGSLALRGNALSGNTDSVDLGIGADLGWVNGPNGFDLQLNYSYGADNGTVTKELLYYGLQYTRDFNPDLFGYAQLQGSIDQATSTSSDSFLGLGAGYRIYDSSDMQWSLQAGPGYRVTQFTGLTPDVSEAAFSVSSDFYRKMSDTLTLTNDTDIISSASNTSVTNDLAVSVSVSSKVALRTSLLTTYNTDPQPGDKNTDNAVGVSLVYDLN